MSVPTLIERAKQHPEAWFATSEVRYRREWLAGIAGTPGVESRSLQQLWRSNHGNKQWRDVPVV